VSLDHLHGILREKVVFVIELTFYADESGIHDPSGSELGSEVASIGGYIATKPQWKTFEKRWRYACKKFKVPDNSEFHMSEFYRTEQPDDSPYFGWTNEKKKNFLRALIKVASKTTMASYASAVETRAWNTLLDNDTKLAIPLEDGGSVYTPYINCLQNFFAKFPRYFEKVIRPRLNPNIPVDKVSFVFHNHKIFGPAAQIGYNAVHGRSDLDPNGVLGTLSFGSYDDYPPLQSADLFAFYSRRRFTRYLKGIPADEFESNLLEPDPNDPDRAYLIYLSDDNLRDLQEKSEQLREKRKRDGLA
jgi:hypothetical protein